MHMSDWVILFYQHWIKYSCFVLFSSGPGLSMCVLLSLLHMCGFIQVHHFLKWSFFSLSWLCHCSIDIWHSCIGPVQISYWKQFMPWSSEMIRSSSWHIHEIVFPCLLQPCIIILSCGWLRIAQLFHSESYLMTC